jgi:hypothetical protein
VNGRKAQAPLTIHDGDEISLGSMCFRAVITNAAQETAEVVPGITLEDVDLAADQTADRDRIS